MKYGIGMILILSIIGNIICFYFLIQQKNIPLSTIQQTIPTETLLDVNVKTSKKEDRLLNFTLLRQDLNQYIATQSGTIGLYFEYIPTGNSIGINEKTPFVYASLLKVPIVMALYKKKSEGKISFSDYVKITVDDIDSEYGELWKKGPGTSIKIQDLISLALINSDNTAHNVLRNLIDINDFGELYESLDIPLENLKEGPAVSAKNYTSILKSLYHASYLSVEDSEEILSLLSHSAFTDGIRKPIPTAIPIAHKMGVRKPSNILSDCGIVYHPSRPYYLCLMIAGDTESSTYSSMQEISNKIYTFIQTR